MTCPCLADFGLIFTTNSYPVVNRFYDALKIVSNSHYNVIQTNPTKSGCSLPQVHKLVTHLPQKAIGKRGRKPYCRFPISAYMRCDACQKTWSRGTYCPSCGTPIQKPHSLLQENLLWVAAAIGVLGLLAMMGVL
jgi:hypothetical protein